MDDFFNNYNPNTAWETVDRDFWSLFNHDNTKSGDSVGNSIQRVTKEADVGYYMSNAATDATSPHATFEESVPPPVCVSSTAIVTPRRSIAADIPVFTCSGSRNTDRTGTGTAVRSPPSSAIATKRRQSKEYAPLSVNRPRGLKGTVVSQNAVVQSPSWDYSVRSPAGHKEFPSRVAPKEPQASQTTEIPFPPPKRGRVPRDTISDAGRGYFVFPTSRPASSCDPSADCAVSDISVGSCVMKSSSSSGFPVGHWRVSEKGYALYPPPHRKQPLVDSNDPAKQKTVDAHRANDARVKDTDTIICLWRESGADEPCHLPFEGTSALVNHCAAHHGVTRLSTECKWDGCERSVRTKGALLKHIAHFQTHGRRSK